MCVCVGGGRGGEKGGDIFITYYCNNLFEIFLNCFCFSELLSASEEQ